jgi:Suppressor of forked protein (Suf)
MVTNRLDPKIGLIAANGHAETKQEDSAAVATENVDAVPSGLVTWHLYASHANMEHRINRAPEVAARIYELGLRKHASFVTKAPYVMRYAQLLLELNDTMNLRALLTRAVAACEAQERSDALAALWDMTLHFESLMSGADPACIATIQKIERQRREALIGPNLEDVSTGGYSNMVDSTLVGAQKSTIAEQLLRSEGYDASSNIVNGLSRTVDVLDIMGLWGSGESGDSEQFRRRMKQHSARSKDVEISGGKSDASFQKRLQYESLLAAGLSADTGATESGSRALSARERLGAAGAVGGQGSLSAMMMAIQQMPDWLRPLLLQLPASLLRVPVVPKPPPHLVEMALSSLKNNTLPVERPAGESTLSGNKRKVGGGDSSDEEGDDRGSGGYGNQFRARQRARMSAAN